MVYNIYKIDKKYFFHFCLGQVDEDLTARVSMQDVRYSFQDITKVQSPNWMSPESRLKS